MAAVVKVETFDVDVSADASTYTLTNDVGNLNAAFIRRPGPSDKASGGPTGSTGNTAPRDYHVGVDFTGTNQLTWRKGSATTQKIIGEVWRYTGAASGIDEFIVRAHTSVTVTGTSASTTVPGIVDRNKCVPFITGVSTTNGSVSDAEGATFAAHINSSGDLVVSRNNSSGGSHTIYVDVVEFTGSRWRVGHGVSTSHNASVDTVILNTDSTGTGGSTFSVDSWNNTFIEASMEGDSSETGLSDVLCVVVPGTTNSTVDFSSIYGDGSARNDGTGYIHVVENAAMGVTRGEIISIAEGNGTYGTVGFPDGTPTNRAIDELALEWMVDTSGTGTAHARGRLNARIINATGTIQHWVHRSGNDVDVAYGVIDLTQVDNVIRPQITSVSPPFFSAEGTIGTIDGTSFGATQGAGTSTLFQADFTAADDTNFSGYTPDIGIVESETAGAFHIRSNQIAIDVASSDQTARVQFGTGNVLPGTYTVSVDAKACPSAANTGYGLLFCSDGGTAGTNAYFLNFYASTVYLDQLVGGSYGANLGSTAIPGGHTAGQVYELKAEVTPTNIICYVDGVEVFNIANTDHRGDYFGYMTYINNSGFSNNEVIADNLILTVAGGTIGKVEISDNPVYGLGTIVEQTINSWSDTLITITSVHTGLAEGTVYVFVTNDNGIQSLGYVHTLGVKSYADFINDLEPDHRWTFDGDYLDQGFGGIDRPANGANTTGSPTFTANPLCRGVSQSVFINAINEGFAPSNSTLMNDGTQTRRSMHGWIMVTDVLTALTALYEEGGNVNNVAVLMGFGNILMGQVADTGDFYIQAYSDFKLEPNRPYHVVWRFGSNVASDSFTMFVDGKEVSVTKGNPVGASDLDSHTGDISWGSPDSLEVGGTDVQFASPVGCRYNEWASWRVELSDAQIAENLFQAGMTSLATLSADTAANMQTALDALASTAYGNWPCALKIEAPTDSPDLTLFADNITFNPGCTYDIEWRGAGTLTWINGGTSNASKASTFLGGGIVNFVETVPVTVTVRDIDTKLPIEGARVYLEPEVDVSNPGGFIETDGNYVERAAISDLSFLPSGTGVFTFPSPWGTTGVKLTDSAGNYASDVIQPVGYAYWRISNNHVGSDEIKILVGLPFDEGGPSIITYNKVTDEVSDPVPIFAPAAPERYVNGDQMHFSGTDPNILYFTSQSSLYQKVNIETGVVTTVFDAERTGVGNRCNQSHASIDDRYHSMTYMDSSFNRLGALVYDATLDTFKTFTPILGGYDECQIDKTGQWLVIKEDTNGTEGEDNRIIDLWNGDAEQIIDDPDGAGGHSDMGYGGVMVAADNYGLGNEHNVWDLTTTPPTATQVFASNFSVYAPQHISWCHASPTIAVADQYVVGSSLSAGDGIYGNEIIAIRLDGSGDVLPIAPVMSDEAAAGGGFYYNKQPKGNTDITGEYFFWSSNTGTDRIDLYMVKIPAHLLTPAVPTVSGGTPLFNDLTDANGQVTTEYVFDAGNVSVSGVVRKGTNPIYYKQGVVSSTITENGLDVTILLVRDE